MFPMHEAVVRAHQDELRTEADERRRVSALLARCCTGLAHVLDAAACRLRQRAERC